MNLESIMARRGKLQPVIKLKQRREQQAGKQLQQCNEQREHHSQLLNQLQRYREEYLAQMERALKGGYFGDSARRLPGHAGRTG